jgi:hypothetical protein
MLLLGVKQVFKREGLSTVYLIQPLTRTHQENTKAVHLEETKKKDQPTRRPQSGPPGVGRLQVG